VLWKVFGRALIAPAIFRVERDTAVIDRTIAEELPGVIDLLALWAPTSGFKFGKTPGLADVSVASPQALEVRLLLASEAPAQTSEPSVNYPAPDLPTTVTTVTLAWTAPRFAAVKGIVHAPSANPTMKPESRDALLTAIAKAREWIADIRLGRIVSFAEIAKHETLGERHLRLLAPLAFVSPRIIAAIVDGTAPADLTVTGLAKALPYSWTEQDNSIGLLE
jgi:hypothetical protein